MAYRYRRSGSDIPLSTPRTLEGDGGPSRVQALVSRLTRGNDSSPKHIPNQPADSTVPSHHFKRYTEHKEPESISERLARLRQRQDTRKQFKEKLKQPLSLSEGKDLAEASHIRKKYCEEESALDGKDEQPSHTGMGQSDENNITSHSRDKIDEINEQAHSSKQSEAEKQTSSGSQYGVSFSSSDESSEESEEDSDKVIEKSSSETESDSTEEETTESSDSSDSAESPSDGEEPACCMPQLTGPGHTMAAEEINQTPMQNPPQFTYDRYHSPIEITESFSFKLETYGDNIPEGKMDQTNGAFKGTEKSKKQKELDEVSTQRGIKHASGDRHENYEMEYKLTEEKTSGEGIISKDVPVNDESNKTKEKHSQSKRQRTCSERSSDSDSQSRTYCRQIHTEAGSEDVPEFIRADAPSSKVEDHDSEISQLDWNRSSGLDMIYRRRKGEEGDTVEFIHHGYYSGEVPDLVKPFYVS